MKFYDALGVSQNASKDEIKKAYKKAAVQHHPDKGGDANKFKEIGEAYAVLSDDDKRNQYNQIGDAGWEAGGRGGAGGSPFGNMDASDIFRDLFGFGGMPQGFNPFGGGGFNPFGGGEQQRQSKANNAHHGIRISLKDAYTGLQKPMRVSLKKMCLSCKEHCHQCQGRGMIQEMLRNGMFTQIMTRPCNSCNGSGKVSKPKASCTTCKGAGESSEEHILTLTIPKGVQSGHKLHFPNMGEQPIQEGQSAGDLILEIQVEDHPELKRNGDEIHYEHHISLVDSIIGKIVTVPHIINEFKVDTSDLGIVQPNKKYIINGKGMPNGTDTFGNLILTFKIDYPKEKLSIAIRDELKELFIKAKL